MGDRIGMGHTDQLTIASNHFSKFKLACTLRDLSVDGQLGLHNIIRLYLIRLIGSLAIGTFDWDCVINKTESQNFKQIGSITITVSL